MATNVSAPLSPEVEPRSLISAPASVLRLHKPLLLAKLHALQPGLWMQVSQQACTDAVNIWSISGPVSLTFSFEKQLPKLAAGVVARSGMAVDATFGFCPTCRGTLTGFSGGVVGCWLLSTAAGGGAAASGRASARFLASAIAALNDAACSSAATRALAKVGGTVGAVGGTLLCRSPRCHAASPLSPRSCTGCRSAAGHCERHAAARRHGH